MVPRWHWYRILAPPLINFVASDQQLSLRDSVSLSEMLAVSLGCINKSAKTHR